MPKKHKLLDMRLTGKGKKAVRALNAIDKDVTEIEKKLKTVQESISEIVNAKEIPMNDGESEKQAEGTSKDKLSVNTVGGDVGKRLSVLDTPPRVEFTLNRLRFYIDFLIIAYNENGKSEIYGALVYGTQRRLCLEKCSEKSSRKERTDGHQPVINRCDGLEDKPMFELIVNHEGRISAKQGFDNEWWVDEDLGSETKKDLAEMHYLTMAIIWHDALNWVNEKLLP